MSNKQGIIMRETAEEAVRTLIKWQGLDPGEHGLHETPRRVVDMLTEFGQPCDLNDLIKRFEAPADATFGGIVAQSGIPVACLCEHHLLPFYGTAEIGYIPRRSIIGLSKLARLVRAAGQRRPTIQERITDELADVLHSGLQSDGCIVVIRAEHTCQSIRGVRTPGVSTVTSSVRGSFLHNPAAREEFFQLIRRG